ncbi:hypothetical protein H6F74_04100 [Trichocoleus sp. FACHB-90]|uniref:hypothetical protein n=1 Tax=Funiculus sociatus TaxID=450527 RepID=UPI001990A6F7|nr:hypothetical protein [Trichocoleus sp. FACHB-90]
MTVELVTVLFGLTLLMKVRLTLLAMVRLTLLAMAAEYQMVLAQQLSQLQQ